MQNDEITKILEVADRYRSYFEEWDADIAFGRSGLNFFYVLEPEGECFDVFSSFRTAEELETLILGDIANKVSMYIDLGAESRVKALTMESLNETYNNYFPESSLVCLLRDLKVLAEENARWCEHMEKTYRALMNIGK